MTNTAREEVVQQCSGVTRGRKDACRNKCHADIKISRLSIRKLEGLWEFQIKKGSGGPERFDRECYS